MTKPYVLGINGSQRQDGNTGRLLQHALDIIAKEGVETKRIDLKGKKIKGDARGASSAGTGGGVRDQG